MDNRYVRKPHHLQCITCGKQFPIDSRIFDGCPACRASGVSSNLMVIPDDSGLTPEFIVDVLLHARSMPQSLGIWKYRELLPVNAPEKPVSLGEGNTALVHCEALGKQIGYSHLYIKNEGQNPTGSFKDRLASAVVNHGIAQGERLFVWSSSGNAGTSSAAYAARAGAYSIGLMSSAAPGGMRVPPSAGGAFIVQTSDRQYRQQYMTQMVSAGAYPTSNYAQVGGMPVGSNPFGTEGYRTIAYEIYGDLGRAPDYVISPTCYGDQVLGIARGFLDLHDWGLCEPMPAIIAALPPKDAPCCISTGRYETAQTRHAVQISHGQVVDSPGTDRDVLDMASRLSCLEGLFLEPSSAAALLALESASIPKDATICVIGTASGFKDLDTRSSWLTAPPLAEGGDGLCRALQSGYGVSVSDLLNR